MKEVSEYRLSRRIGVSTGSGSDRVALTAISFLVMNRDPVASTTPRGLPARGPRSTPGTDLIAKVGTLTLLDLINE